LPPVAEVAIFPVGHEPPIGPFSRQPGESGRIPSSAPRNQQTVVIAKFKTRLPAGRHVTLAGLTGADWPQPEARPVAWRLRVLNGAGQELAAEQSFLWVASPSP
jgi:hypothetical protein